MPGIVVLTGEAQRELQAYVPRVFKDRSQDGGGGGGLDEEWDDVCRSLAAVVLLADDHLESRVNFCFTGQWAPIDLNLPIKEPGLLALYRPSNPVTVPALGVMRFLGLLIRELHEQQQPQHPAGARQRASRVAAQVGRLVLAHVSRLDRDLNQLQEFGRQSPMVAVVGQFDTLRQLELPWLYAQAQPLLDPQYAAVLQTLIIQAQQQQAAPQQQQQQVLMEQQGVDDLQEEEVGEEEEGEAGAAADGDEEL
jgi:hypothetical protein